MIRSDFQTPRFSRTLASLLLWPLLLAGPAAAQPDDLDVWWWTTGGGGASSGGDYVVTGTISRPDSMGTAMTGGDFTVVSGFWSAGSYSPGDLNCDGVINAFDIDPFVLALTDPAGYDAAYPDCDRTLADVNGDGKVDAFDIDPFVALLIGP